MTNQQLITNMFDQKISKEEIYHYVVTKNQRKRHIYPYLLAPLCILLALSLYSSPGSSPSLDNQDVIYINDISSITPSDFDALAKFNAYRFDVSSKGIVADFSWLDSTILPEGFILTDQYGLFIRDYSIKKDHYSEEDYTILKDYVYYYTRNEDSIRLALTPDEQPLRDYFMNFEKTSLINGTEVVIGKYNKSYTVNFEYNDYYFDIETHHVSEEELITFLKSILYSET